MKRWDILIIGAGPAGLTAGIYCGRAQVNTAILEAISPGGQVLTAGTIENYPGFPGGVPGPELMGRFLQQVKELGVPLKEFTRVVKVSPSEGEFAVETPEEIMAAKAIIIATGAQPARLGVPGEDRFMGQGVSFCATCDGFFYRDRTVAVIGGGDRAVEEAIYLSNIAKRVFLIHRRSSLRAQKILQDRAFKDPKISPIWNTVVKEVLGDEGGVKALKLKNLQSGEESTLSVDGVFVAVGQRPATDAFQGLVEMDEKGFIKTDERCATSKPGVFAAGDVRAKELRQVSTAVGDGAVAASSALAYLESL